MNAEPRTGQQLAFSPASMMQIRFPWVCGMDILLLTGWCLSTAWRGTSATSAAWSTCWWRVRTRGPGTRIRYANDAVAYPAVLYCICLLLPCVTLSCHVGRLGAIVVHSLFSMNPHVGLTTPNNMKERKGRKAVFGHDCQLLCNGSLLRLWLLMTAAHGEDGHKSPDLL